MNEPIRRTDSVKIKLAPDMITRLESAAQAYGMPPSTLCAFAVADWLNRQEQSAKLARMGVLEATRGAFSNDQMMTAIESALPGVIKALQQQNLSLDGEAAEAA